MSEPTTRETSYAWATGYHAHVDAEQAGRALARLAQNGELTAERIVKAARSERSPLHASFQWDDALAAHEHRLALARSMARSIRVITPERPEPKRAYFHVHIHDGIDAYVTEARVLSESDLYEALKHTALAELNSARLKYREITELSEVWDAIDQLTPAPA